MTKNELAINNWVRHRDQGEKPYRITSITIDGDKYLYTAEGLTAGDTFVDVRAAAFEPIALNEIILKSSGYVQMVDPNNVIRSEKYFSTNTGAGIGAIIEVCKNGQFIISMSGGSASFLTKKIKYLHELQNLCKSFDNSIVNVDWSLQTSDSTIEDEGEPMW
jgi:hypothetical protein